MDKNHSFTIIPLCIYHYIDYSSNIYHGFIINPILDVKEKFKCSEYIGSKWKFYKTFYAFSPMFRPIPNGLKIINASKIGKFPYNTKTVEFSYDPFNIDKAAVSFITWSKPVIGTIPLYLWITSNNSIFPTFENIQYDKTKGWTETAISPIYVLIDPTSSKIKLDSNNIPIPIYKKDKYGIPEFKFKSFNGQCIPNPVGDSIEKCFLLTDEDINRVSTGTNSLLNWVQTNNEKYSNTTSIYTFFKNISPVWISICVVMFFISLIICIIEIKK
jgi:hypothetical protein